MNREPRAVWAIAAALLVAGTAVLVVGRDGWKRSVLEPTADAAYYYAYLPTIVLDRDLDFTNEYAITKNWYRLGDTATGRPNNVFGIGPAVFQLPAFLLGHAIARIAGSRADGFSRCETGLVLWTAVPFTLAALLLAARLARRRVGPGPASYLGPLVALLAGPVAYYAVRQPGYAHPYATFCVAWLVERWDASYDARTPRALRTWLGLGLALGAATLARPQLALWGVLLGHAAIDDLRLRGVPRGRMICRWLAAGGVAAAAFAPQLVAWKVLYGSWYVVPQGPGFMRWDAPAWLDTLFSSRNGLFPWAPLYAPMLLGLLWVGCRWRLATGLLIGVLAQAVVNGAAWDWWGGGSFGGRRFDSAYVVFALGGAALVHRALATLRSAGAGTPRWQHTVRAGGVAVALALAVAATVAQLRLLAQTSVVSARITGGESASGVFERQAGIAGQLAGWLSAVVTAPVRAGFALEHDVDLASYDQLVGVHLLGETYPGLNSYPDKRRDTVSFRDVGPPRVRGLGLVAPGVARMTGTNARVFIGLNRRGSVRVKLSVEAHGHVRLAWNGVGLVEREAQGAAVLEAEVPEIRRGVNWLEIEAPSGTQLREPELFAQP